jgi:hypothetical protein
VAFDSKNWFQKLNTRLLGWSALLGRFPSLGFALLYILVTLGFAGIYWSIADQFYHTTSQYEPGLSKDKGSLEALILAEIKKTEEMTRRNQPQTSWPIILRPSEFQVDSLHISHDEDPIVSFVLTVSTQETRTERGFEGSNNFVYTILVAVPGSRLPGQPHDFNFTTPDAVLIREPSLKEDLPDDVRRVVCQRLFPPIKATNPPLDAPPIAKTTLSIPKSAFFKLMAWINGMRGFPASSSGTPWRMLYLSATTITTLGLGDILPISDTARVFVGLESFLGVVLIGLFLNSLSSEIQRNRKP